MEHFVVTEIVHHGYLAVFVLMLAESACIPIPSEAIMLFGGALAGGLVLSGAHPHLNVVGVALAGSGGNLVGSWLAYLVGRRGGRRLIARWGRKILLRPNELDRAEAFFARRGDAAVLIGRVVPVVRTFISLPAGIAKMPFIRFSLFTFLGCLPWTFALALAGDALASHWASVSHVFTPISVVVAVLLIAVIAWRTIRRLRSDDRDRRPNGAPSGDLEPTP